MPTTSIESPEVKKKSRKSLSSSSRNIEDTPIIIDIVSPEVREHVCYQVFYLYLELQ